MDVKKYFCETCWKESKGYLMSQIESLQHEDMHPTHKIKSSTDMQDFNGDDVV